jgi:hypothetical protein
MDEIINKVASSGLVSLDLENFYPSEDVKGFDLKPFLFMEMILKEKDFRQALRELDWSAYDGKAVAVYCSADAIIPMWAYMLVTSYLQPTAAYVFLGNEEALIRQLFLQKISALDIEAFRDQRVVIKGCGDKAVPPEAYVEITRRLQPVVKSIMFGEPCSTVPVYKKKG